MARKLDSTITVTLSFPSLLRLLASLRGGGFARINGDLPYPSDGAKQISLPTISVGIPLPEDCEVVSASSNGDYVNVTLWHESFAGITDKYHLLRFGCCALTYNDSEPSRQELLEGLERTYPTST